MIQLKVQQALQNLYDMKIIIKRFDNVEMKESIEIAHFYEITVYDAVFVALAEQLGANSITDDRKLYKNFIE